MIIPKIDPLSPQAEGPGRDVPKTTRRDPKSISPFRQVLEETLTERPEQRPKSVGRTKSQETANKDETATEAAAAQGAMPPIFFGRGHVSEPILANNSVPGAEQSDTRKECSSKISTRLPLQAADRHYFTEEAKQFDRESARAAGPDVSNFMTGSETLTEKSGKQADGTDPATSPVHVIDEKEPHQVARGLSGQLHRQGIQAEDKMKSDVNARDRPDSARKLNSDRGKAAEPTLVVREVITPSDGGETDSLLGSKEASRKSATTAAESSLDAKPASAGAPHLTSSNSISPLPPAKQISDCIGKTISITTFRTGPVIEPDGTGLEKSLYLDLHPESIGRIRLSLLLRGDELRIRIEAKSHEASEAIEQDRGLLGRLLSEAGFQVSPLDIKIETQAALGESQHPDIQDSFGAKAHGSGESGGGNTGTREPSRQQVPFAGPKEIETSESARSPDLRRSGIYI